MSVAILSVLQVESLMLSSPSYAKPVAHHVDLIQDCLLLYFTAGIGWTAGKFESRVVTMQSCTSQTRQHSMEDSLQSAALGYVP